MIGIIGAMEIEVDALKAAMQDKEIRTIGVTEYCAGNLFGASVVVAKCGVGKVNAALCAQNMIHTYAPRLIINTGCAAGVGDGLHVGDIVIASEAVQYDLDYGPLDIERGYIDGIDRIYIPADEVYSARIAAIAEQQGNHTRRGTVATADYFLSDPEIKKEIKKHFHAEAVEMEGGAVAQAACANGVPFVILRSVSDNGDDEAVESFETFAAQVNKINMQILKQFLEGEQ
ncbi:MAG: 5'-methylthioadenosine/adenosylhomocysteine nucleosidase [Clostridia bacterium]|nr:5'-methylthioadenosine/adenosylhomocysteine nucleosidase [Clostridia bacterium]